MDLQGGSLAQGVPSPSIVTSGKALFAAPNDVVAPAVVVPTGLYIVDLSGWVLVSADAGNLLLRRSGNPEIRILGAGTGAPFTQRVVIQVLASEPQPVTFDIVAPDVATDGGAYLGSAVFTKVA